MKLLGRDVRWSAEKNIQLQKERNVNFEQIVAAIATGNLLDDLKHPDWERYPRQRWFVVSLNQYAYIVPYVEENDIYFLKTIYPSRKMTRRYLRQAED